MPPPPAATSTSVLPKTKFQDPFPGSPDLAPAALGLAGVAVLVAARVAGFVAGLLASGQAAGVTVARLAGVADDRVAGLPAGNPGRGVGARP